MVIDDASLPSVAGRTVLIAGGTSAAGRFAAAALVRAGARVVVVGRDSEKLARVAGDVAGVATAAADLTDEADVRNLYRHVHAKAGPADGILHLVGGWRGGGGLAGQSDDDYRFLERSFTALRHVTRAFDEDLRASPAGRLAIVSSTAVAHPLAGGANYAAVKAASEAWTHAVAQGFAKDARDAGKALHDAAVVFRVKSLSGLEQTLADAFVALWNDTAERWNGVTVELSEGR
jgi:NAD(P)-dependent dehydrogenase (short-subunit alcohol dehydrogenase family)